MHQTISKEELNNYTAILLAGNNHINILYERARHIGVCKNKPYFLKRLFAFLDSGEDLGIRISMVAVAAIQAVRDIHDKVVLGHIKLAKKIVNRWCIRTNQFHLRDDFEGEAFLTLSRAVYYYRRKPGKKTYKLYTYMGQSVRKMLFRAHDVVPSTPWTKRDRELHGKYEATKKQFTTAHNQEEVIAAMGELTPDQRAALLDTLTRFIPGSVVIKAEKKHSYNHELKTDYSLLSSRSVLPQPIDENEEPDIRLTLLKQLNFSKFELAVLQAASQNEGWGWQTRLCNQFQYSRRAAGAALLRIRHRLKEVYEQYQQLKKSA